MVLIVLAIALVISEGSRAAGKTMVTCLIYKPLLGWANIVDRSFMRLNPEVVIHVPLHEHRASVR